MIMEKVVIIVIGSIIGAVLTVVFEVVIFYFLVIHEEKQVDKAGKELREE